MATINETTSSTVGGSTRTSFLQYLKDDYLPELNVQLHLGSDLNKHFARMKGKMGGKKSVRAAAYQIPDAGQGRFEQHTLPQPSSTKAINPEFFARTMFWRLRWSMEVVESAAKGTSVAWRKPMAVDLEYARKAFELTMARKLAGSFFDILGTVKSSSGTTITLYPRNDRTSATGSYYKTGAHYLRVNQQLQLVKPSQTLGYGHPNKWKHSEASQSTGYPLTISSVTAPATSSTDPTIVVNADPTGANYANTAITDYFVTAFGERQDPTTADTADGPYDSSTVANNIANYMGLNGMDSLFTSDSGPNAAIYGLAKGTYAGLNAYYSTNSGTPRQYTERFIENVMDQVQELSGNTVDTCMMHPAVTREHAKENRGQRLFPTVIGKSGHDQLAFQKGKDLIPIMDDWQVKPGIVYFWEDEKVGYWEQRALGDIDPSGGPGFRFVADRAAIEMAAAKMGNVEHENPFGSGSVDDISFNVYDLTN